MNRVEHGERIRNRHREIILRSSFLAFLLLMLPLIFTFVVLWTTFESEEPNQADDAPEVQVIVRYATEEEQEEHDQETLLALARTVWGEARGCTTTEQAAVVWCVLNRVDSPDFPDDILEVLEQPNQFSGYGAEHPVWPEILALVEDVLDRWKLEKTAVGDVGRVLPKEYVFFEGDGKENHFRTEYRGGTIWDWSLDSPYKEGADDSTV